ncbi:protein phosphatase 2C domain-containing protein [Rhodovulum sulfidophilum]|uniref:PP2C family serine/threonine-protein phosphatase n=1 Tax=Rhodovulum sulfidophilum TaxID=35806 RepID=UPI001922E4D1|nr:PP2C family serine/threonine-protein phosphatase [Rhodovulum sulfidophilum]MBL3575663.1 protein phosphatase 2C domain-containing protein [Rhodovulum sulfidophilum]MCE8431405.1 protein phosphatase 2C domain-containing protein [Rhodovulum sulfidophilum]MCF4118586.1 protein phosphatase 2C domain-containing protein [Rhodovulum sulfidophilum]
MVWRWVAASKIGTSHIRNGDRLQDAYAVSVVGDDYLLAIVSDGAGSAKFGAYGAWMVCRTLSVLARDWFRDTADTPNDDVVADWIDTIRDRITGISERRGSTPRQFAATLVAVITTPQEVLTLHIGDSAAVGRRSGEWDVLCWPENGEYASTTFFVTDDPEPRLNIQRFAADYDAFALFSDGIGDLALSHKDQSASPQFFNPMLRPVDSTPDAGCLRELSSKLGSYLSGASICERTDDDKTLILISGA